MIILFLGGILSAAKESWHFITSAVKSGVESAVSYGQSIAGGLTVDKETYDVSYDFYEKSVKEWQAISQLNFDDLIPDNLAAISPFDWREKHVIQMRIQGINPITGEQVDRWITVESDKELTKGEWLTAGQSAVDEGIGSDPTEIDFVAEYEYYVKGVF